MRTGWAMPRAGAIVVEARGREQLPRRRMCVQWLNSRYATSRWRRRAGRGSITESVRLARQPSRSALTGEWRDAEIAARFQSGIHACPSCRVQSITLRMVRTATERRGDIDAHGTVLIGQGARDVNSVLDDVTSRLSLATKGVASAPFGWRLHRLRWLHSARLTDKAFVVEDVQIAARVDGVGLAMGVSRVLEPTALAWSRSHFRPRTWLAGRPRPKPSDCRGWVELVCSYDVLLEGEPARLA